jgi:two-component sensor histidine kinase
VDPAEFMYELCGQFKQTAQPGRTIEYDFLPVAVRTDRAVPPGLLTSELATNALKYACPDVQGSVSMSIRQTVHGYLRLEVSDSRSGLPEGFDMAGSKSLGMKVINCFSWQIGGRPAWEDVSAGTRLLLDSSRRRETTAFEHGAECLSHARTFRARAALVGLYGQ